MALNVPADTAPSAPAAGSLASMNAAPPSSAADASLALATLTSSRIALQYHRVTAMLVEPLAGRAVLVTGASSGIGRAIALAAARAGADVAITYRANRAGALDVERELQSIGRRAVVLQLDLADERSVGAVGAAAVGSFGRLDAWVNNAGADILTGAGASMSDRRKTGPAARRRPARDDARVVGSGAYPGRPGRRAGSSST